MTDPSKLSKNDAAAFLHLWHQVPFKFDSYQDKDKFRPALYTQQTKTKKIRFVSEGKGKTRAFTGPASGAARGPKKQGDSQPAPVGSNQSDNEDTDREIALDGPRGTPHLTSHKAPRGILKAARQNTRISSESSEDDFSPTTTPTPNQPSRVPTGRSKPSTSRGLKSRPQVTTDDEHSEEPEPPRHKPSKQDKKIITVQSTPTSILPEMKIERAIPPSAEVSPRGESRKIIDKSTKRKSVEVDLSSAEEDVPITPVPRAKKPKITVEPAEDIPETAPVQSTRSRKKVVEVEGMKAKAILKPVEGTPEAAPVQSKRSRKKVIHAEASEASTAPEFDDFASVSNPNPQPPRSTRSMTGATPLKKVEVVLNSMPRPRPKAIGKGKEKATPVDLEETMRTTSRRTLARAAKAQTPKYK